MKRFLHRLGLFSLPLLVAAIGLLLLPVDRRQRYAYLKDDCFNHGLWIHDRLFRQETPVDLAFLGSSRTLCAVNDEELSKNLDQEVVNLGYCRLGRNLIYVLLQDLLEARKPARIVIEVRENEDRYSHPVFPFLANEKDAFLPVLLFNRDLFSDAYQAFRCKLQLSKDRIFQSAPQPETRTAPYGFAPKRDIAQLQRLQAHQLERRERKKDLPSWQRDFYWRYPLRYLGKIGKTCRKQGVELYFLYLPGYGSDPERPTGYEHYRAMGQLLLPPPDIFADPDHWFDENHLNAAGAEALTEWLEGRLR